MSIFRSFGLISTSTSSASGSTATVAVEVWMRPPDSVTGTRCTRCTPDSYFSLLNTPLPEISSVLSLMPPNSVEPSSISSHFQPCESA